MSEQDGTQSPAKRRRSRKTSAANQQNGTQAPAAQRPATDDAEIWKTHWKAQGQPWRTEPEIDAERQIFLAARCAITPNIEQGIYPFKGVKLSRADVEWLLVTHEQGRGPVDWSDENQRTREGLDLRGADLRYTHLNGMPLARTYGEGTQYLWSGEKEEQYGESVLHLEGALLRETHLEGARLTFANLKGANLEGAYLEEIDLNVAELEEAFFREAHLEKATLVNANLKGAWFVYAHLEGAFLEGADLEEAWLTEAYLEGAFLIGANLRGAYLVDAHLERTDLRGAELEGAHLTNVHLSDEKQIGPRLVDTHWGLNVAVVKWSEVSILADEHEARQEIDDEGEKKDRDIHLEEYENAVRANRQLAIALQSQGLNEDAARFAYRAQVLQKRVFWLQMFQRGVILSQRIRALGSWLFSWSLFLLTGYGYRVWRSFATYVFVIGGFATAYYLLGPTAKLCLSPLDAIIFSMTSFHGRGFSPGENIGLSNPLTILAAIEAFVGLVIEITLIATLTQRFFGK